MEATKLEANEGMMKPYAQAEVVPRHEVTDLMKLDTADWVEACKLTGKLLRPILVAAIALAIFALLLSLIATWIIPADDSAWAARVIRISMVALFNDVARGITDTILLPILMYGPHVIIGILVTAAIIRCLRRRGEAQ